jgi:hypothetical protein
MIIFTTVGRDSGVDKAAIAVALIGLIACLASRARQ